MSLIRPLLTGGVLMAATYEPIASTTLASDSSEIEFTSIPSGYTDLVVVHNLQTTDTGTASHSVQIRFNGDTGTNYSDTLLYGDGSSAASTRGTSNSWARVTNFTPKTGASNLGVGVTHIMSYANTNVYKTFLSASGSAPHGVTRTVGLWRSTSAITSLSIFRLSYNLKAGSSASLFGLKAA